LTFREDEGLTADRTLDDFDEEYDAVFLAMGLGGSPSLEEGRPAGVEDAVAFLERCKCGEAAVPERVAVLGGGNTAMDAAVQAALSGARDVYLVYRRSLSEMPAWPAERDEAMGLGVHFLLLTQPLGYVTDEGRLRGVRIARTVLGEPDASGRRKPVPVQGSESVLEADLALEALGQELPPGMEVLIPGVALTGDQLIKIDEHGHTSRSGVYAGGDIVNGGTTVVRAIADGMRAAEAIDAYLEHGEGKPTG
jgi:NADPH-dependent glutamate synthase beta subunit-like oxidoreductase